MRSPNESPATDKTLLERMKKGDKRALSEIYNLYWESLYDTANFILSDRQVAEDVTHDVFLSFWNGRKRIKITHSIGAYLRYSTRYKCFKIKKRNQKTPYFEPSHFERLNLTDNPIFEELEYEETSLKLKTTLAKLPTMSRKIFTMNRDEELTYVEIAQIMGVSKKTVEYHMSKVLKVLRRSMLLYLFFILG